MKSSLILRWMAAAGFITYGCWIAKDAESPITKIFSLLIVIMGACFIIPEAVRFFSYPVTRFFSGLAFPQDRNPKPILSYKLARYYGEQARFAESIEEYKKIIKHYPKEQEAYLEMLTLAMESGDMPSYKKYAKTFKRRFNCDLSLTYEAPDPNDEFPGFKNGRPRRKRIL
ncbi:MAG: hypothetical protein ABIP97_09105 [Chthoniobacterales bacterium]